MADDLNRIDDINCILGKLRDQPNPESCESDNNTSECDSDGPNFAKECNEGFLLTGLEIADLFQQPLHINQSVKRLTTGEILGICQKKTSYFRKPGSHCFIMRVQLILCHHK